MATTPIATEQQEDQDQLQEQTIPKANVDPIAGNKEMQTVVKNLAKYVVGLDKWARRMEVLDVRRQRFYWRDDQYIYVKATTDCFFPIKEGVLPAGDEGELPRYTDVYNIYTPYGESLAAPLLQNPPGVNWQPADPSKPEDVVASQKAEKYQQKIEQDNDQKFLQSEAARLFYTDGRTIFLTLNSKDEEVNKQEIKPFGVLESKMIPITAKDRSKLVACVLSEELDIYEAKEEYPDAADQITKGTSSLGESAYERIARLGVLQGTKLFMQAGDAFNHLVTKHRVLLRPAIYRHDKDAEDELKATFPDGIYVVFCGEAYCESMNADMDDHLTVEFPIPGDGMNRPSQGKRVVPVQDTFNDEINLWHEAHDYCIPTTFMYSETGDIEAIRSQISQPGNIVPFTALPPGATSAAEAFFEAVMEAVPATLPALTQFLQGPLLQFITGAFPALFGGDTGSNDTAKGIAIQRDQAMGRQGVPWSAMQRLFASAYEQAVRLAVKRAKDDEKFSFATIDRAGNRTVQSLDVADLKSGQFKCVPDTDSSLPETTSAKRAALTVLMTAAEKNPAIAEVLLLPDNMEFLYEVLGLPEIEIPSAIADIKQRIEIDQLLKEPPVPPTDQELAAYALQHPEIVQQLAQWDQVAQRAAQTKQPPPSKPIPDELMKPSIPVDKDFDYHLYEFEAGQRWLSSKDRRDAETDYPQGVLNVRLHLLQHKANIPPPPMPPLKGGKLPALPAPPQVNQ